MLTLDFISAWTFLRDPITHLLYCAKFQMWSKMAEIVIENRFCDEKTKHFALMLRTFLFKWLLKKPKFLWSFQFKQYLCFNLTKIYVNIHLVIAKIVRENILFPIADFLPHLKYPTGASYFWLNEKLCE